MIQFRWEIFYSDLAKYKKPFWEQIAVIVKSAEALKNEESRKTAKESWNFFDLIEGHLKDEQLRNFLEGAGKILFEIQDLDPYIHFSRSVMLEKEEVKKEWTKAELVDLLRKGRIKEFSSVRPYLQVDLSYADFTKANLSGVNLSGANLCGANLSGAKLVETDLRTANLTGAVLWDAFLTGANLRGANLSVADLYNLAVDDYTLFEDTLITGVKNLSPEIRDQLHIKIENDIEKATSKWLLEKRKSEGKT
jgi:hypothetical protein